MLETFRQDVRHGARLLVRNPGFSLVAILSIGVGVAVSAAMFSVADGMLLRPMPVPRPGEVVTINGTAPNDQGRGTGLSYLGYHDLRDRARSFTGVGAHRVLLTSFAVQREDQAESRLGFAVSGNLFDVLEVRPELGRFFVAEEDRVPGRDAVVVISHDTWVRRFHADPAVVGKGLRLGGVPFTVIGVAPESFTGLELVLPGAYYVPLAMLPALVPAPQATLLENRDVRMLNVKARLKPEVSLAQARAEIRQIGLALEQAYPALEQARGLILRTHFEARQVERGAAGAIVAMMMTMALTVLLVACANVAGLLTSRAPARAREMAVRLAIGSGRLRIVRQLMTEALLIAVGGGVAGIGLSYAAIQMLQRHDVVTDIGVQVTFATDRRVLAVAIALAAASALVAGLIPAWRSAHTGDLSGALRNGAEAGARRSRLWGRHSLVVGQVALGLALVTVSVFLYRALNAELRRGPGFATDHVLLVNLDPTFAKYDGPRADRFYQELKDRVLAIPGVTSVALSSFMPLNQDNRDGAQIAPEGYQFPKGIENIRVSASRIDEGYFETMRTRLVAGRGFLRTDTSEAPRVTIVNQTLAAHYWPGLDPLGKRLRLGDGTWAQVVGVAADNRYNFIAEGPQDFVFLAARQDPAIRTTLIVGVAGGNSAAVTAPVRAAVQDLDREVPITGVWTMEQFYEGNAISQSRLLTRTVGSIGIVGVALAMVGLYGLVAYTVSRRTREIGIRMAIGAQAGSVLRMVMRQGLVLVGVGTALGIVVTFGVNGVLRAMFPSSGGVTLSTFAIVVPALLAVTLLAALVPALRAARIDPLRALRQE